MLQWLYTYIASACFKCFTCFRRMLQQVLHVASVFISRHEKQAQVKTVPACMHNIMACIGVPAGAGTCGVLGNLVLVAGVHDNDQLQLLCFSDHASLQIGAHAGRWQQHASKRGLPNGGQCPDVQTLATPSFFYEDLPPTTRTHTHPYEHTYVNPTHMSTSEELSR
jgi:hypothetical protein